MSASKRPRLSGRNRLGENEWQDRLERLMRWVDEFLLNADREQAEEVLHLVDGHVGNAVTFFESSRCSSPVAAVCRENSALIETLDREWWNNRFREDGDNSSDWLLSFEGFGNFLTRHLSVSAHTLVPGCGNSQFSAKLYASGFRDIVNTDHSNYAIGMMRRKHADPEVAEHYCEGMSWEVDDVTEMSFGAATFDQIVDKSLLDCMTYCDEEEFEGCIGKMLRECFRVLKPGGVMVVAMKRHISALHEHIGGAENEFHWCGLAWSTVSFQQIFVPKMGEKRAVARREELPEGSDYFCMYVYCIRKQL